MPRQREGGNASGGEAVWDTGSSLYDSYELAAVRRLLAAGVRPLHHEPPPVPAESKQQIVAVGSEARRTGRRNKVTLRTLFRAVVSWAIRPRKARAPASTSVGIAHGGAVEPVVSPHGKV